MAKKRVHEIAKERGISSKEVIAVLQRAGLDVKAAASSVDEGDIAMAFSNGGQRAQEAAASDQPAQRQPAANAQSPAGDGSPSGQPRPAPVQPSPQGRGDGGRPGGDRPQR